VSGSSAVVRFSVARPRSTAVAALVPRFADFRQRAAAPIRRRELPGPRVVLVFELGEPARLVDPRSGACAAFPGGFVAGLDDAYAISETAGDYRAVQVDFTPIGAARFFAAAPRDLASRVVRLEDAIGSAARAREIVERLAEAPDAATRFAILDRWVEERLSAAPAPPAWIERAWSLLEATGGSIDAGALAREIGLGRKHVGRECRERLGMTPKRLARLLRFERAVKRLEAGRYRDLAAAALDCGYYDQAHFNRDFRAFAGASPGEIARARRPDASGYAGPDPVSACEATSVQDAVRVPG